MFVTQRILKPALETARYITQQVPKVQRVDPSLRHWMLYTPWHVKLGLGVRARQWKKFTGQYRFDEGVRVQLIDPRVENLPGGLPSYLNVPETRHSDGAILFIHGGGHLRGVAEPDQPFVQRIAHTMGVPVLSVAYRSAEDEPFPADFDDCYAALRWLQLNAPRWGVNPAKIAVVGKSAGGGLAAAVAQKALDEGHPVGFQGLLYPMLDDRTALLDDHEHRGEFFGRTRGTSTRGSFTLTVSSPKMRHRTMLPLHVVKTYRDCRLRGLV